MTLLRRTALAAAAAVGLAVALVAAAPKPARDARDPLAAEIARLRAAIAADTSSHPLAAQIRAAAAPALDEADAAMRHGRRLHALQRLGGARNLYEGLVWTLARPEAATAEGFEAAWRAEGAAVARDAAAARALSRLRPAAVRAMAEAALPQAKVYYHASLEYGRNTMPEYGLYYLGAAQAQRDFAAWSGTLAEAVTGAPPPTRALAAEIAELERDLLAGYRPPASIDRHPEFIAASALLKEARELDEAGLRYGALHRYLQAALRSAPLRDTTAFPFGAELAARLDAHARRLGDARTDHSLGRLLLETAHTDVAAAGDTAPPRLAAAVAADVLPRYFAALGPAPPRAATPAAAVTVTLVRWPYT
jgi:hypothetical protein